ncbi:unnamed protein product [Closterium sp. NIES-65]|nr:unnamed protein product [Closterium sp. NIES-65]
MHALPRLWQSGRKETVLDLARLVDKGVCVKLNGGRQGDYRGVCVKIKVMITGDHPSPTFLSLPPSSTYLFPPPLASPFSPLSPRHGTMMGTLKGYDQLINLVLDEAVEYERGSFFCMSSPSPCAVHYVACHPLQEVAVYIFLNLPLPHDLTLSSNYPPLAVAQNEYKDELRYTPEDGKDEAELSKLLEKDGMEIHDMVKPRPMRLSDLLIVYCYHMIPFTLMPIVNTILNYYLVYHPCNSKTHFLPCITNIPPPSGDFFAGAAAGFYSVPVLRNLLYLLGTMPASESNIRRELRKKNHMAIVIGGLKEVCLGTTSHTDKLYLMRRKGFARIAVQEKVGVIPIYCFNENQLFKHDPVWFLQFWEKVNRHVNIGVPFMRGAWNLTLPFRRDLLVVVGKPLFPEEGESVDDFHARYVTAITQLFHKYVGLSAQPNQKLVIV